MKHIQKNTIILITISLLALLAVGIFIILFYRIQVAGVYTLDTNTKIMSLIKQEEEFSALQKTIIATDVARNTLAENFVSSERIVNFLEDLEQYGKSAGTNFTLLTVDEEKDGKSLRVAFSSDGSFIAIHQLLLIIEKAPYEIVIDQATLTSSIEVLPIGELNKSQAWHLSGVLHLVSFIH